MHRAPVPVPVPVRAAQPALTRAARCATVQVTDQFKSAHDPSKGFVLPGVFFIYDISPIMVKFTEKRGSRSYFLTSLCAIVGGVFTVAGIIDGILYQGGAMLTSRKSDGFLDR